MPFEFFIGLTSGLGLTPKGLLPNAFLAGFAYATLEISGFAANHAFLFTEVH